MKKKFNVVYSIIMIIYVVSNFVIGLIERVNLLLQMWKFVWKRKDRDSKIPFLQKFFAVVRAIRATARFFIDIKTPVEVLGKRLMSTLKHMDEDLTEEEIKTFGRKTRFGLSLKYRKNHRKQPHGKKRG